MKSSKKSTENKPAAENQAPSRWPLLAGLAGFAILVWMVYGPAMSGPFLFDDRYLPFMLPNFAQNPLSSWVGGVRPVLQFTFWVNYQLSGLDSYSYHAFNVLFHLAAGLCAWLIARKLLAAVNVEREAAKVFAIFAAAVFLLHPLQSESVGYVASRSEVASGLFALLAWVVFLYRREASIGFGEAAGVVALFLLAVATKEHTAVFPVVLLLTDFYFNPGFTLEGIRRNWRLYAPLFAAAALGVFVIFKVVLANARTAGFGMKDLTPLDYLFTQFRSVVTYLRLFVLPFGQNVDYDTPISRSLGDHLSWLCLLILLALTGAAWVYRKRFPLASFGFLLFLVFLAPTSSIVPIEDVLVERRMYLPVFALTLCVIEFMRRRKLATVPLTATLGVVCAVLAMLAWQRNQVWAGPVELWTATVAESPKKYRPHFQLAFAYYQAGRCADAMGEYAAAEKVAAKPDYELQVDWALAADCAGRPADALLHLESAVRIENNAHAWALTGMVRAKQGELDKAMEALAQAEKADASYAMTHVYRGNIYQLRGDWDAAIASFERAARIDPWDPAIAQALAAARAARPVAKP